MTEHMQQLPDVLRPTELHDFSDSFGAPGERSGFAKAALAVAAVVLLMLGATHIPDVLTTQPPATVIAAR